MVVHRTAAKVIAKGISKNEKRKPFGKCYSGFNISIALLPSVGEVVPSSATQVEMFLNH